jgi:[ribosomal protein S18]-alanine N-acetyltransferase
MRLNIIVTGLLYVNNVLFIKLYEKLGFRIVKEMKDICSQSEKYYLSESYLIVLWII